MEKSEVTELVMMLFAAFPAAKGDAESWRRTLRVYGEMLIDLDVNLTRQAVMRLVATAKWLPTIAEIRAASTDLRLGPVRDGGEAWKDVMEKARFAGRYDVPEFEDPLVSEALRLWGSWQSFCDSPEDDPGGRARFIELYDALTRRKRDTDVSGIPLPAPERPRPRLVAPIVPLGIAAPAPVPPVAPVVPIAPAAPVAAPAAVEPAAPVPMPMMPMVPRKRFPDPAYRRYTAEELEAALKKPPGGTDGQRADDQAGGAAK
jgi:hypothetical protein